MTCARFEKAARERVTEVVRIEDALCSIREVLPQPRILGDKLPGYLYRMSQYPDHPEILYVFVYRDCRAVVHSAMRLRREGHWKSNPWAARFDDPVRAAMSWVSATRCIQEQAHRSVILRYEDLVVDTQRALLPVAEALGTDVQGFDLALPHDGSLDRWRREMAPSDIRRVEFVAGEALQQLGYPLCAPGPRKSRPAQAPKPSSLAQEGVAHVEAADHASR
jgi:hypothetical protein